MKQETFSDKREPGTVFQYENQWYIADSNHYISAEDADFADDVNDVQIEVGWRTVAHLAASEQDLALVAAHQEEEARKAREYQEKWAPIYAERTARQEREKAVKQAQLRERMLREFPVGTRVQNKFILKLVGSVIAHHETEPKLSIQWDGQDHPAYHAGTTLISWFGIFDQKAI